MEDFSELAKRLWNGWEIRVMVLLSLFLQIILISFASKRKYNGKLGLVVWSCYLAADWVATFALGNLAIITNDCSTKARNLLQAFWAPFFLLHLGGPDSITAFSLEDNELWLRHLLGFLVQVVVALCIFWNFLINGGILTYLSIPMFVVGMIKYGERSWVLKSSSAINFKESLLGISEFGQNDDFPKKDLFSEADYLFKRLKYIFTELPLSREQIKNCLSIIRQKETKDAFLLVEIELGFMYDALYTKAPSLFSKYGIFLRCFSLISSICVLLSFAILVDKHQYPTIDTIITYLLLVGAVYLEFYSFTMLILSDHTYVVVARHNLPNWIPHFFEFFLSKRKRWSRSMPQLSLLDVILKIKMNNCVKKSFHVVEVIQNYRIASSTNINSDLQSFVFKALVEKGNYLLNSDFNGEVLKRHFVFYSSRFDRKLLSLHIATEICYHDELSSCGGDVSKLDTKCKISKCLSDYLLYLLVMCPLMLPKADTPYKETCEMAMKYFENKTKIPNRIELACGELLESVEELETLEKKEKKVHSVMRTACKYALRLKGVAHKWEQISEEWMALLIYAAGECSWREHGQQLSKGGEFLTHVSLLMAHLGLSPQFIESYKTFRNEL